MKIVKFLNWLIACLVLCCLSSLKVHIYSYKFGRCIEVNAIVGVLNSLIRKLYVYNCLESD